MRGVFKLKDPAFVFVSNGVLTVEWFLSDAHDADSVSMHYYPDGVEKGDPPFVLHTFRTQRGGLEQVEWWGDEGIAALERLVGEKVEE